MHAVQILTSRRSQTTNYCAVARLEVPRGAGACSWSPKWPWAHSLKLLAHPLPGWPSFLSVALEPFGREGWYLASIRFKPWPLRHCFRNLLAGITVATFLPSVQAPPGWATHAGEILALPEPLLVLEPDHSIVPASPLISAPAPHSSPWALDPQR